MSWEERLKEAAYTSPSGTRLTFDYEDVSRSYEKKTTAFEFPDADGTYVQDLGKTGRRYPFQIFIWGENYDLEATAFEEALAESGIGILEHPVYGTVNVVVTGAVTRRDNVTTRGNQAVITATFWDTINTVYPVAQVDPGAATEQSLALFNQVSAEMADVNLNLEGAVERVTFRETFLRLLDTTRSNLSPIFSLQDGIGRGFNTIYASIAGDIDNLILNPSQLVSQTLRMIQLPALTATSVVDRITAYSGLIDEVLAFPETTNNAYGPTEINAFYAKDVFATAFVTGAVISVLNNQFSTKTEAIEAADLVISIFDGTNVWRENHFELLEEIDTGEVYQQLQESVAIVAGFLVFISFSLRQERIVILDRARTIIDLIGELYGQITNDDIDFFISSNSLIGSEILELPRGREVKYYV
jgi:prophage DNA circulation protein